MSPESNENTALRSPAYEIGIVLVRHWRRIAVLAFAAGFITVVVGLVRPRQYTANTSFFSQNDDAGRSGLSSLAGQFGIALATGDQSASPDFFARFLVSQLILRRVSEDTLVVQEMSNRRVALLDLLGVSGSSEGQRIEKGARRLKSLALVTVVKPTGVVEVAVTTKWASVSKLIADDLLQRVNEFNTVTRQSQARDERKFIEGRLALAREELRSSEDRMQDFLVQNRAILGSAELGFQRDRLARDLAVRQGVVGALTQSYEEVRIREVRNTPLITVIETPSIPLTPDSRGLAFAGFIGTLVGLVIAVLWFVAVYFYENREEGVDSAADEFFGEIRHRLLVVRSWIVTKVRTPAK